VDDFIFVFKKKVKVKMDKKIADKGNKRDKQKNPEG